MVHKEKKTLSGLHKAKKAIETEIEAAEEEIAELRKDMEGVEQEYEEKTKALEEVKKSLSRTTKALDKALKDVSSMVRKEGRHVECNSLNLFQNDEIEKCASERFSIYRRCKVEDIDLPLISGNLDSVPMEEVGLLRLVE